MTLPALLADAVLVLHAAFVAFVLAGGLLVPRWPRVAWVHLPAAAWGAWVEFSGWVCPLTPLEDRLRLAAGQTGGGGDFLERLLMPLLYPDWLTRSTQVALGVVVLTVNAIVYWHVATRRRRASAQRPPSERA